MFFSDLHAYSTTAAAEIKQEKGRRGENQDTKIFTSREILRFSRSPFLLSDL
jgi:hypothetical protein